MPDELRYPKWLYDHKHAPTGKLFNSEAETEGLSRKGWVENPSQFPKRPIPKLLRNEAKPWWTEWKWFFKLVLVIIAIALGCLGIYKAMRGG
jgi:hypothetical protein